MLLILEVVMIYLIWLVGNTTLANKPFTLQKTESFS
ncbi:hypothetical protein J2W48_000482 [Flavobacterium piscis]|uniref:Uncharacterized protein n=1 Tax=Flavobacterium piscis TaxID=1114874 RepID=A0ABU1Y4U2_9FLAO|nr:hypothetical protein [Flavobacterium piscis]